MESSLIILVIAMIVGFLVGWLGCERYVAVMEHTRHDYEELFEKNPHPELYNDKGRINRGEYIAINFPPDYDPEEDEFYIEGPDDE